MLDKAAAVVLFLIRAFLGRLIAAFVALHVGRSASWLPTAARKSARRRQRIGPATKATGNCGSTPKATVSFRVQKEPHLLQPLKALCTGR